MNRAVSREERATGRLAMGEMDGKRFAEHIGVAHGTVKRWLHEGMPALRQGHLVWITPDQAKASIAERFKGRTTIAIGRNSYIYLARAEDGLIKIGWSSDVMRRIQELRKYRGQSVHLLACFPGDTPDELRLHARFSPLRSFDEWYEDDGTIAAFVRSLATGGNAT